MSNLYCGQILGIKSINNEYMMNFQEKNVSFVPKTKKISNKFEKIEIGNVYVFNTMQKNNKIICIDVQPLNELII